MKNNDTQRDTIVSKTEMSLTGPILIIDMDLTQVPDEDLVALLLLEEERKAEAEDNIQNIRDQLFLRVEHGAPLDVWKHDQLGGEMGVTVTVMKKHIKAKRTFDDAQVIRVIKESAQNPYHYIERKTVEVLDRKMFLADLETDKLMAKAMGHLVRDVPETYRLEVQRVSAWLKLRRQNE